MIRLDTIKFNMHISFRLISLFFVEIETDNGIYIDDFPMNLNKLYR